MRPGASRLTATVGAGLLAASLLLTGCTTTGAEGADQPAPTTSATATDAPRALTSDEAQGLATMRFRNYAAGVRSIAFAVTDSGKTYDVEGWADYAAHLGYATVSEDDAIPVVIGWSTAGLSTHDYPPPVPDGAALPPLPPPDLPDAPESWVSSDLDPTSSRLHTLLAMVVSLGNDRPDNPLLLQQSDARWLRTDDLDGTPVTVYAGPSSEKPADPDAVTESTVRYWVDDEWTLLRLEARLGGDGEWTKVDLGPADDGVSFADAFAAGAAATPGAS